MSYRQCLVSTMQRVSVFMTHVLRTGWQREKMYNGHALNGNNSFSSSFISNNLRLVICVCCLNVIEVYHNVLMEIGYRLMWFHILACIYTHLMDVDISTTMYINRPRWGKNKLWYKRLLLKNKPHELGSWESNASKCLTLTKHKKGKGKAIPLQPWTGPEGSRRLRLPDFKTVGTWRWSGCQPYAPAAFTFPGNIPGTHFC